MIDGIASRPFRRPGAVLLAAAIVALAAQARAGEPVAASSAAPGTVSQPGIDCTCRFDGADYHIGDTACIRGRLATCATFLNNTSWAFSSAPCPLAGYRPPPADDGDAGRAGG